MALNDFTGQNIQDTYQKVVQTDGTSLADGTGSLLPISFDGNNVTISGSLTANEYIVSSSVTNITVATLSGSTEFGNTTDDTHTFIGNITASGNISASGQIDADKIRTGGRIASSVFDIACAGSIDTDGTISSTGISNSSTYTGGGRVILSGASSYIETPSYVSASNIITTNITASGDISASGNVITSKTGLPYESAIVYHAGGINLNVDDGESPAVKIGADFGQVAIGPDIDFPSNQMLTVGGTISASGHIQTQAGVYAEHLHSTDDAVIADTLTVGTIANVNTTHITASGNISASGEIIGTINGGTF